MSFVEHTSTIRTIRQGDEDFMLVDGFIQYPRAMLHVLPECPQRIKEQLAWAMENGYIKCVAHVHDKELVWDKLAL